MNLTRREMLGALAAPRPEGTRAAARKPNFVFILIDDMGWTDLGCFGSTFYESPNVDALARRGVRFTNGYAACPVCSPSRAAVMTGMYPARLNLTDWIPGRKQWPTAKLLTPQFNQQLPLEEVTIAEALKGAGYATASIGKWHLGGEGFDPTRQGFDLNVAGTLRGSPASYFGPFDLPGLKGGTSEDYLTDRLAVEAEKFIDANRDRPFFLYLPNFAVHIPLQAKKDMIAAFQAKVKPGAGHNNAIYAAMIKSMDEGVGRVVRKLDDLRLTGNTMIVFTSDNGGLRYEGRSQAPVTSNAPLRAGKGHAYEGGIRVPLIVSGYGVARPGTVCDVPVSSIDYFPTITAMVGGGAGGAKNVDGVDIAPLLKGGKVKREALYWHYPHYSNQGGVPAGAVRQGDFKLIEFYEDGRPELFNLRDDPGEKANLARKLPKKAAELHSLLKRWRGQVNARMPEPNPAHDPAKADQGLTGVEPKTEPI